MLQYCFAECTTRCPSEIKISVTMHSEKHPSKAFEDIVTDTFYERNQKTTVLALSIARRRCCHLSLVFGANLQRDARHANYNVRFRKGDWRN